MKDTTRSRIVNARHNGDRRSEAAPDIVVFSHLRWQFVTQRPQHVIARMAANANVLFVEEPVHFEPHEKNTANIFKVANNVTVLQPRIGWERMLEDLKPLVEQHTEALNIVKPILWFYSPAFHEITNAIDHCLVVYDCMDELSAFKGAPASLINQERALLGKADVVFTGGKSLYESKTKLHANVRCYPSSVDAAHFAKAFSSDTVAAKELKGLPRPVVGYIGVIDERIDLRLLDDMARQHAAMSFVMIGPVVKIDPNDLPKQENIHYLGMKDYAELPSLLKGIDIAMMPFALNESTRFISPTKTLEYIAAMKAVVSTPIADVVRDYTDTVCIADDADEFAGCLLKFIDETPRQRAVREANYKYLLGEKSWDNTVAAMKADIAEALRVYENAAVEATRKKTTETAV
jgi:glycosyltransferase involved in cell wall biosynthesis